MSSLPVADVHPTPLRQAVGIRAPKAVAVSAVLAVLGAVSISSTLIALWALWTNDALKSIGMFIPPVSFFLILRAWKRLDWELRGTWWGAVVLAATAVAVHLRDSAVLVLVLSPQWSIFVPPHSLVVVAYASGVVLLFGGPRLFRAALFPLLLLWFVNPVPHIFNVYVDLPLQRISAHVARGFAIALHQKLSPDQLRLMFTPDFGMFIAPGCNGIRGAVTMGFIALVAGYLYRFRWYANAAIVLGAVLLGYLFNLLRLCTLVLYYIVALHLPWLQPRAEMGDYIIGACLFLIATFLLFYVIQRFRTQPALAQANVAESAAATPIRTLPLVARFGFMLALALFGGLGLASAMSHSAPAAVRAANSPGIFPAHLSGFTLSRSWNESLLTGTLLFHWADYAADDGGPHVSIAISPVLGSHDTLICHSARGEDPLWHGQLDLPTTSGQVISFSGAFFNDGATQYTEATTLCNGTACGEFSDHRTHFGLVYSRPDASSLFSRVPTRPIPIILRAETIDTTLPPDIAREQLTASLASFAKAIDLNSLTQPYR